MQNTLLSPPSLNMTHLSPPSLDSARLTPLNMFYLDTNQFVFVFFFLQNSQENTLSSLFQISLASLLAPSLALSYYLINKQSTTIKYLMFAIFESFPFQFKLHHLDPFISPIRTVWAQFILTRLFLLSN